MNDKLVIKNATMEEALKAYREWGSEIWHYGYRYRQHPVTEKLQYSSEGDWYYAHEDYNSILTSWTIKHRPAVEKVVLGLYRMRDGTELRIGPQYGAWIRTDGYVGRGVSGLDLVELIKADEPEPEPEPEPTADLSGYDAIVAEMVEEVEDQDRHATEKKWVDYEVRRGHDGLLRFFDDHGAVIAFLSSASNDPQFYCQNCGYVDADGCVSKCLNDLNGQPVAVRMMLKEGNG